MGDYRLYTCGLYIHVEYQPVWKTQGEADDGDAMPQLYIYIAWSSVEGTWCISGNMGKKLASMDAKSAKFGFDKVCVPDGYVSVPALAKQNLDVLLASL